MISLCSIHTPVLPLVWGDGYQRTKLRAIHVLSHSVLYLIMCNIIHLVICR